MPPFVQPPFTFPNPRWPYERDHSFIAPFYAESTFQYVGSTRISNVWFRTVHRPKVIPSSVDVSQRNQIYTIFRKKISSNTGKIMARDRVQISRFIIRNLSILNHLAKPGSKATGNRRLVEKSGKFLPAVNEFAISQVSTVKLIIALSSESKFITVGRVIDPILLDNITRDVQEGINGANGWRAEFALVVTWERMAYGGAPKAVDVSQFEYVKQWQNTFQLIIASDEIRSYTIFNYARLNWTTSNEAGGLNGFGGKQAAMVSAVRTRRVVSLFANSFLKVGFNGGNGTGWTRLPYSGEGRVWKLAYFTNVLTPGRWVYRVDEEIVPGGCSNDSTGEFSL